MTQYVQLLTAKSEQFYILFVLKICEELTDGGRDGGRERKEEIVEDMEEIDW